MNNTTNLINQYGREYLVCDGKHPLISAELLKDELVLYNIDSNVAVNISEHFYLLTNKNISRDSIISELSGGQKAILMFLLAIYSPAPKVLFVNLFECLDINKRIQIEEFLNKYTEKTILVL